MFAAEGIATIAGSKSALLDVVDVGAHLAVADKIFVSSSVLPFVQKIFFGTATTKDYTSTGSYGAPMASAFPWSTASPPK